MARDPVDLLQVLAAGSPQPRFGKVDAVSRYLPMRDGTRIAVDVMLPRGLDPGERLPAVLIMARYWRSIRLRIPEPRGRAFIGPRDGIADYLLARGFAVVVVDARGTGASLGVSRYPFAPDELEDYAEVARWIRGQPWSNGAIGATGVSYEGSTALYLGASGTEGVRGLVVQEIEFDVYRDIAFPGGVYNQGFVDAWDASNRLLDANRTSALFGPWWSRWMLGGVRPVADDPGALAEAVAGHRFNTDVGAAMRGVTFADDPFGETGVTLGDFSVPARLTGLVAGRAALCTWGSWLDMASADAVLSLARALPNPQVVVIGDWKHEMTGGGSPWGDPLDPPRRDQHAVMARFLHETLVDRFQPEGTTIYYRTLGRPGWTRDTVFPPAGAAPQRWWLGPDGTLLAEPPPPGNIGYQVDFSATTGRHNRWLTPMAVPVSYPDRAGADRHLLTWTSGPLGEDLEITGYPEADLWVTSDREDSAFFLYLEEVDEHGVVRYATEGILRAIHRRVRDDLRPAWAGPGPWHTFRRDDAMPLQPGEPARLRFALQPVSVVFRRGRRIRIALAGADAGTFARVPAAGDVHWTVHWGGGMA